MTEEHGLNSQDLAQGSSSPLVVISILNWNGWEDTLKCLESVRQLGYPNYLTVVADNGSGNESVERLRAWAQKNLPDQRGFAEYITEAALQGGVQAQETPLDALASKDRFVLIRNRENLGFTGGHNVTIQYAMGRPQPAGFVFLLNNDAIPARDTLTRLVEISQAPNVGIVGTALNEDGEVRIPGHIEPPSAAHRALGPLRRGTRLWPEAGKEFRLVSWVWGAAVLIRSETLRSLFTSSGHYLNDELFLYVEEVELCRRAQALGFKVAVAYHAVVHHKPASSSGWPFNPLPYYYLARNQFLVTRRHLAGPWLGVFYAAHGAVWMVRAAKNLARGRVRPAYTILAGLIDGYRGITGKWKRHDQQVRKGWK